MKNLILLGFAIILFTGCQEKGPERWTKSSPEVDVTKELIKDYAEGNWDSWIGHYIDTAKVHHNSVESIRPQQLLDGLKNDISNYNSYGFSDEEIYYGMIVDDKNDKWVYFWGTWEATLKKADKEFEIPVHLALKFVDNKIVEEYAYYNRSAIDAAFKEIATAKETTSTKE